ncbi:hypothetical protein L917_10959 [Phytophthora nicotianae]|uniref:DUF6570 domain-containing protein n=2 Tax=Phytophthora nicotianae TaxID=4792 RepID=W2KYX7_PHYNI|nr:hypothetical protein L917_10959 [Phytophthora nicotianae]ETO72341.1 hypothetical protein F444_11531 [Phytophthora nicotianae P1976]
MAENEQHEPAASPTLVANAGDSPREGHHRVAHNARIARDARHLRVAFQQMQDDEKLAALSERVLHINALTVDEVEWMGKNQHYVQDPRLALAYYYCCGTDPGSFVFGDEQLRGDGDEAVRERISSLLDDYPKESDIAESQQEVLESAPESTTIWACAACGRVLLQNKSEKVYFSGLQEIPGIRLSENERNELFADTPKIYARSYRQLYFRGSDVYYLILELLNDGEKNPLCENYISPARCFGLELSLSGRHSRGHAICFPTNGPCEIARHLPKVDGSCAPRITFIGPRETWRVQKKKFKKLYEIPVDSVYQWLNVLVNVNNVFKKEVIQIEDSPRQRELFSQLDAAIVRDVQVLDSVTSDSLDEVASAQFDEHVPEGELTDTVFVRKSAVLPVEQSDPAIAHDIIDAMASAVGSSHSVDDTAIIPIKRGKSPFVEWVGTGLS